MINRREMLGVGLGTLGSVMIPKLGKAAAFIKEPTENIQYAAFIKFVQTLSYDELAENIAACGYHGIEATVRKNGYIEPDQAVEELPILTAALKKFGLKILQLTTDVININDKVSLNMLKVAAGLGIKQYRMSYYNYNLKIGSPTVVKQLAAFKPALIELAAFNHETGIQGLYQNHAGARMVGATVWDLKELLNGVNPKDIGAAYDIRHAAATSGDSWPVTWDIMQEHLGCIYVKDCKWVDNKIENTPLGTGMVDNKFFGLVKQSNYQGTISVHVEYLQKASVKENLAALKTDLLTLKKLMN